MDWLYSTRYIGAGLLVLVLAVLSAQAQSRDFGVDLSHGQASNGVSQTSWNLMFAEGKRFAFVKASEGLTGPDDPTMLVNTVRATAAGLLVGVYHHAHPENQPTTTGAVQEADHFLSYAGTAIGPGRLRPALDLEGSAANLTATALTDWVIAFSNEIIAQRGPNAAPIICTTEYFANARLDSRLADYDLWLCAIEGVINPGGGGPQPVGYPTPTGVFHNWAFWLYSMSGSAGGISPLDLDVCHSEYKPLESFLIPVPGTLPVAISCTPTNTLVISWPLNSLGYVLQENPNLGSTNWVNTAITPTVVRGRRQALLPSTSENRFYRLICPP